MKILVPLLLFCAFFVLYIRFLEKTSVFLPEKRLAATPQDAGITYSDVRFNAGDRVTLHGWLVPEPLPSARPTLLFLHGNAGNIGDRLEKISIFCKMGLNVFIFDYRGYGQSEGEPTEQGMYRDCLAAYDYLASRPDVDPGRLVVYGESLGGAAAIDLAAKRPVPYLILDSTFTSAADMAKKIFPGVPAALLSVKFDSVGKIKSINSPKLFIHSIADEIVPYRLGKKLFAAAPAPKDFLEVGGNHNDGFFTSQRIFINGIKAFLRKYRLIGG